MPTGHPVVERDQLRILPIRRNQRHQLRQLFKTKQKKQMRIPVPPEMPPQPRKRFPSHAAPLRRSRLNPAKQQHHANYNRPHAQQPQRVPQMLRKQRDQHARRAKIRERRSLKRTARGPRRRRFSPQQTRRRRAQLLRRTQKTSLSLIRVRNPPPLPPPFPFNPPPLLTFPIYLPIPPHFPFSL